MNMSCILSWNINLSTQYDTQETINITDKNTIKLGTRYAKVNLRLSISMNSIPTNEKAIIIIGRVSKLKVYPSSRMLAGRCDEP